MKILSQFIKPLRCYHYLFYWQIISSASKTGNVRLPHSESHCNNPKFGIFDSTVNKNYNTPFDLASESSENSHKESEPLCGKSINIEMPLDIKPAKLGVEIRGVNLNEHVSDEVVKQIKELVHKHRILIFRDQGVVSGERHVEISRWFGELESTFYKHPRSPHPDVFRVSNVESEGCRNVGRTGWHIDGSFMAEPFSFALYHMASVPKIGNTAFVPLRELIESLSGDVRRKWEQLWMVSDRRASVLHPLIYPHPVTSQPTLCFHLGMTESFMWNYGTDKEKECEPAEVDQILKEMHREINKDDRRLVYSHKWEVGDFIISDNLAVGHEATPETQLPQGQVGLRVLHRTTVKGVHKPKK